MDHRLTPATPRIAHTSLRGKVDGAAFTDGTRLHINAPLVDLLRAPHGPRERQLWLGDSFTVIDRDQSHAFGFADKDGYCGWLPETVLSVRPQPTHWIASPGTHLYPEPRATALQRAALPMGARVHVIGVSDKYAETLEGFIPASHLKPLGQWLTDPATVAEQFLHTPYLWGGNSRAGLDCSGLVQIAHLACGIAIAGDADLQEDAGQAVHGPVQRGDLLFWEGHVAIAVNAVTLIHANGNTMSVAYENIASCIARITAAERQPMRSHRRL